MIDGAAAHASRDASSASPTAAAASGRASTKSRRAAHTAYTIGRPVTLFHSAPRSKWCGYASTRSRCSASSPMSSRASKSSSTSESGPRRGANSGSMPHSRQSTLSRQMEVALFSVSATRRICASGVRANSWMESTAP